MEWINIKDRLPEDKTEVLLHTDEGIIEGYYDDSGHPDYRWTPLSLDWHGCGCCGGERPKITHWAKYPDLPKD